jgi:trans-2,3-dihydro-3-hydroxyanthranilate isomerase
VDFYQIDVFTSGPFEGNPLAVFPAASGLGKAQMQAIAREMNLSETSFVTETAPDSYSVRIFTPAEELPFAGHPTVGTAWLLHHLGLTSVDEVDQRSGVGTTTVTRRGDSWHFRRAGRSEADIEDRDPEFARTIARALGIETGEVGAEARELGRPGRLRPAYSNAGLQQLMVPVRNVGALTRCRADSGLGGLVDGAYCFTPTGAGHIRSRGLWPGLGVVEDPGTGSAAAALGVYLVDRVGPIQCDITQGVEIGRPCTIELKAEAEGVQVGGRCALVFKGTLEAIP